MRGALLAVVCGCGFSVAPGTGPQFDAPVIDGRPDAAPGGRCGGKVWFTDFSADPTTFNNNNDGINDFALRNDTAFPAEQLVNGEWVTPGSSIALDTRPAQPFSTRTIVNVKMRSTTTAGTRGAVLWLNAGFSGGTHIAVYVNLKRSSNDAQQLELVNKVGNAFTVLSTIPALPLTPIVIELDVDPAAMTVALSANGTTAMRNLSRTDGSDDDRWATVVGYDSAAAFDELRVEVCP